MYTALIICLTILGLFGIAALTFKWFIAYDKETTKKVFKEKISRTRAEIEKETDLIIEKNIEQCQEKLNKAQEELDRMYVENKAFSEELESFYKEKAEIENIIPLEEEE